MEGFNAKNNDDLNSIYKCPACSLILREPVQLACGHRQCKTCTTTINGEIECTECHEKITEDQVIPDRGFQNDMKSLSIICSLCEWIGFLKDYEEHLDQHKQNNCTKMNMIHASINYTSSDSIYQNNSFNDNSDAIHPRSPSNSPDYFEFETFRRQDSTSSEMEITMGQTFPTSVPVYSNANNNIVWSKIYERVQRLTAIVQTTHGNTQHLLGIMGEIRRSIHALILDTSALNVRQQDQSVLLRAVQLSQQILQQDIASLTQEVDAMQYASYDGTLIWKIPSFREKMMDAQSERQTSINSPPFYSSPTGYKMRARLYLHGDGNARRTHMSLFFVLMRGPNDAILNFPFNYKVTFCLYDQTPNQRHIIDSFRPDIGSSSFQRPRSEMNIASGIPKFFPLSMIQQEGNPYVQDDTMFIKVMVDFGDIPKTLLPYALSLNPGLPMHTQQAMIKQEVERRAQQQQQQQQTPTSPGNRQITMILPQNTETQVPPSNVTNDDPQSQEPTNNDKH